MARDGSFSPPRCWALAAAFVVSPAGSMALPGGRRRARLESRRRGQLPGSGHEPTARPVDLAAGELVRAQQSHRLGQLPFHSHPAQPPPEKQLAEQQIPRPPAPLPVSTPDTRRRQRQRHRQHHAHPRRRDRAPRTQPPDSENRHHHNRRRRERDVRQIPLRPPRVVIAHNVRLAQRRCQSDPHLPSTACRTAGSVRTIIPHRTPSVGSGRSPGRPLTPRAQRVAPRDRVRSRRVATRLARRGSQTPVEPEIGETATATF